MRKAQNVVKFGLKLGAFATLAVTLSSCFVAIVDGGGTPSIDSLVAQSTYCRGAGISSSTKIDFRLNAANITVEGFDAIVSAVGEQGDSNVTDPTTQIQEGSLTSTNITTIPASRISGTGTLRSFTNLIMNSDNQFAPKGSISLTNIKPKITASVGNIRLWVRAAYSGGKTTGWLRSGIIAANDTAACDP
jgi:hypothetical protein